MVKSHFGPNDVTEWNVGEVPPFGRYESLLQRLVIFLGTWHQTTVLFEEDHLVFNRPLFKIWDVHFSLEFYISFKVIEM